MKKMRLISIAVAALTAAQLLLAPAGVSAAGDVQGIVVSESVSAYSALTEEQLKAYAKAYEGTQVTDYVIDVFGKALVTPSEVTGLDRVDVLCDAFKAAGINTWLAFDMNDTFTGAVSSKLSSFYKSAPKRVTYGSKLNTTYHSAMNYSSNAVREYMLGIIKDALTRYDCDGIELDFQNVIWMWSVGGEYNGLDILDGFMRKVDRLVRTFEASREHEIKISVRCASDLETNYELGIDVATWVADGIIDRVVPTASGNLTDFDVPVRVWTALMHPYGGEVVPSIQAKYVSNETWFDKGVSTDHTIKTLRGVAANWFSQGVDKVYMNGLKDNAAYNDALTSVGSYEALYNLDRQTVLTYNNVTPFWTKSSAQLPKTSGQTMTFRVPVGDIPADATVTLRFIIDATKLSSVFINSKAATNVKIDAVPAELSEYSLSNYKLCTCTVPAEVFNELYLVVEVTPSVKTEVSYMDVIVDAK